MFTSRKTGKFRIFLSWWQALVTSTSNHIPDKTNKCQNEKYQILT